MSVHVMYIFGVDIVIYVYCNVALSAAGSSSSCAWQTYVDTRITTFLAGEYYQEDLGFFDSLSLCQEACLTATSIECASVVYHTDTFS